MIKAEHIVLYPEDKDIFANYLLSLKKEDLIKDEFNGYEYRKEFKLLAEIFNEWKNSLNQK
ncbi:MAG: hypothetical protein PHF86_02410 [Candidatus Nanoarchaeia archaeon]|nr:hypothetical protein [Candidatus Nanoarchaeia archaeon]